MSDAARAEAATSDAQLQEWEHLLAWGSVLPKQHRTISGYWRQVVLDLIAALRAAREPVDEEARRRARKERVIDAAKAFIANPRRDGLTALAVAVGAYRLAEGE